VIRCAAPPRGGRFPRPPRAARRRRRSELTRCAPPSHATQVAAAPAEAPVANTVAVESERPSVRRPAGEPRSGAVLDLSGDSYTSDDRSKVEAIVRSASRSTTTDSEDSDAGAASEGGIDDIALPMSPTAETLAAAAAARRTSADDLHLAITARAGRAKKLANVITKEVSTVEALLITGATGREMKAAIIANNVDVDAINEGWAAAGRLFPFLSPKPRAPRADTAAAAGPTTSSFSVAGARRSSFSVAAAMASPARLAAAGAPRTPEQLAAAKPAAARWVSPPPRIAVRATNGCYKKQPAAVARPGAGCFDKTPVRRAAASTAAPTRAAGGPLDVALVLAGRAVAAAGRAADAAGRAGGGGRSAAAFNMERTLTAAPKAQRRLSFSAASPADAKRAPAGPAAKVPALRSLSPSPSPLFKASVSPKTPKTPDATSSTAAAFSTFSVAAAMAGRGAGIARSSAGSEAAGVSTPLAPSFAAPSLQPAQQQLTVAEREALASAAKLFLADKNERWGDHLAAVRLICSAVTSASQRDASAAVAEALKPLLAGLERCLTERRTALSGVALGAVADAARALGGAFAPLLLGGLLRGVRAAAGVEGLSALSVPAADCAVAVAAAVPVPAVLTAILRWRAGEKSPAVRALALRCAAAAVVEWDVTSHARLCSTIRVAVAEDALHAAPGPRSAARLAWAAYASAAPSAADDFLAVTSGLARSRLEGWGRAAATTCA